MIFVLLPALAWLASLGAASAVHAEPRHASMILDANTGAVLHSAAGDELRHPASLTKMMTLYLAFEAIEQGKLSYQSKLKVSQEAASVAPSKLELEPGEEIVLIDAMKALVTKSANDMAVAVAERIGGTQANFARLMTARAHQLGMKHTVFKNASGLPDPEQVTTARDMITLSLHLQDDFPKHYPLFALKSFTYGGASFRNHNSLLFSYRGTDGIKTGYTRMSGFNLVASVHRDGKHLIGAIFGGSSAASRNVYLKALLDRSLPKASTQKSRKPMLVAKPAPAKRPARQQAVAVAEAPRTKPAASQAKPAQPAKPAHAEPTPQKVAAAAPARPAPARPAQPVAAPYRAPPQPAASAGIAAPDLGEPDLGAPEDTADSGIQIAKVRRIMVAPRVNRRPVELVAATDDTSEGASDTGVAPPRLVPQHAASGSVPVAAPTPTAPVIRRLPAASSPSPPAVARGQPPSTFQAQADNIARGGKPFATAALATGPSHLRGPIHAVERRAAPADGGYQIQIGAYATPTEAEQRLTATRQKAVTVLAGHQPLTIPVSKGTRQLYRARFTGFSGIA